MKDKAEKATETNKAEEVNETNGDETNEVEESDPVKYNPEEREKAEIEIRIPQRTKKAPTLLTYDTPIVPSVVCAPIHVVRYP